MYGDKDNLDENIAPKKGLIAKLKYRIAQLKKKNAEEDKLEEEAIRNLIFICMKQQCILRMERLGGLLLHSLKNINLSYRS